MEKSKKFIIKNKYKIIFAIILLIAIVLRIYSLKDIPYGIHVDEAGMAYDAYCLANYGTDRWLNHMPIYLLNFGSGQSALYAYLAAFLIKIFGFGIIAIRMPAVILSIIAIILCYLITKEKFGEKFSLTFMALVTICPWHIMASRWGLDCNLLAPMTVISIYLLSKAKSKMGYIFTGISFGITLYSYALSYLIIPIFLVITVVYMLYTKKTKWTNVIVMAIPLFIMAIPLMLMILINNGVINEIKGVITINKMWEYRGAEISLSNIKDNVLFFKTLFTNDSLIYNAFPQYGTLYLFASFLAIFGFFMTIDKIVKSIKKREFELDSLFLFLSISVAICMLLISEPNINKANAIFIPLLFFTTIAIKHVYKNYEVFFLIIVFLYGVNFSGFVQFYFSSYNEVYRYQPFFENDLIEAINYVQDNETYNNKNIKIITSSQQPYIYTLLNNLPSPYEFNEQLYNKHDLTMSYGRYYFYYKDIDQNSVYIIKDDAEFMENLKQAGFEIKEINSYILAY